jgi:RNA polymerase sigma-70 factor (ECF subfamily)
VRNFQRDRVPATPVLHTEEDLRAAYRTHGAELYRFARRALDDEGLAEEAVQEVFLRAWRAADRFDPHLASLRTWLFAIARNVVVDFVRRRKARPQPVPLSDAPSEIEDGTEALLRAFQVEEALRRLSPDHRTAIVEAYYKGRPTAEVAEELGVPAGTLRSRIFYGLRALRLTLEEMGWTP